MESAAANPISRVMKSVYERSRAFLLDEMGVKVLEVLPRGGDIKSLSLRDVTVLMGVGGSTGLLVSFSYEQALLDRLFEVFTGDIEVAEDERDLYVHETASEVMNTVLGHCTGDLAAKGERITLTPPLLVDQGKTIERTKGSVFASLAIKTDWGMLDVSFVGSRAKFLSTAAPRVS